MAYARPTWLSQIGFGVSTSVMVVGVGKVDQAVVGANAVDGVSWTSVTGLQEFHTRRGRVDELSKMVMGSCSAIFQNDSGILSPENAAGAYYPNILPNKRLQIIPTFSAVQYPLYQGFIQDWGASPQSGDANIVTLQCVDYFDLLALAKPAMTFSQEASGTRIGHVLDQYGIVGALRDLDAGKSNVAAVALTNTSGLTHIEDVELVESGLFYVGPSGVCIYRDRHARITRTRSNTSQATFGGASGKVFDEGGLDYLLSSRFIMNDVHVTRTGGVEQIQGDATSKISFGTKTQTISSASIVDDTQAMNLAKWNLGTLKDAVGRIRKLTVTAGGDDALWTTLLSLDIGDRITVVAQFPSNFGMSIDFWIEGISIDATNGLNDVQFTFFVSRASTAPYLIVGSATKGLVGVGWVGY